MKKNILIACEESQTICKAFREKGFNAFSCDILDCSGGCPQWHIKGDCVSENIELMPLHLAILLLIFIFIVFVLLGCFLEYIERI